MGDELTGTPEQQSPAELIQAYLSKKIKREEQYAANPDWSRIWNPKFENLDVLREIESSVLAGDYAAILPLIEWDLEREVRAQQRIQKDLEGKFRDDDKYHELKERITQRQAALSGNASEDVKQMLAKDLKRDSEALQNTDRARSEVRMKNTIQRMEKLNTLKAAASPQAALAR